MLTCTSCSARFGEDARFCPGCGHAVSRPPTITAAQTLAGLCTEMPPEAPVSASLTAGQEFAGRYLIGGLIGAGGMGEVYRATDRTTGEVIALKVIRPERLSVIGSVQQLVREGAMARRIRHDNVVSVFDVAEAAGSVFLSMELLEGETLRAWNRRRIRAGQDCPFSLAADIVRQLCQGLEAAHAQGVIHRDLKPENVFLQGEPRAGAVRLKILDFGLARANAQLSGVSSGTGGGTPLYMAPEQVVSPDAVTPAADIYSLSMIFYELLTDVPAQGVWHPPGEGRKDVPAAIDELIHKGLASRPRSRVQTAEEFRRAVDAGVRARVDRAMSLLAGSPAIEKPVAPKEPEAKATNTARTPSLRVTERHSDRLVLSDGTAILLRKSTGKVIELEHVGGANTFTPEHAVLHGVIWQEDMASDASLKDGAEVTLANKPMTPDRPRRLALQAEVSRRLKLTQSQVTMLRLRDLQPVLFQHAYADMAPYMDLFDAYRSAGPYLTGPDKADDPPPIEAKPSIEDQLSRWLVPEGRINVGEYRFRLGAVAFGFLVMTRVAGGLFGEIAKTPPILAFAILGAVVWVLVVATIQRLHDLDRTGYLVLPAIPLFPIAAAALAWMMGKQQPNRFGPPSRRQAPKV